jgi:medium-chain acyl-[acyl-carrier-protein] hydrolase
MSTKLKLFCIPYAGGSANYYRKWEKYSHDFLEIVPLELAGRGTRIKERCYENIYQATEDLLSQIKNQVTPESPFALYGHSMGGYLIYELYEKLCGYNIRHIFISGMKSPQIPILTDRLHDYSTDNLISTLKKLGGTPPAVLENEDSINLFLPIVRSDFKMIHEYTNNDINSKKIHTPISILHGLDDDIQITELDGWEKIACKGLEFHFFEGDHFFLYENEENILSIINKSLNQEKTPEFIGY